MPMSFADDQPQSCPSVSATSSRIRPPDRSSAPGMSSVAALRCGDGGTKRATSAIPRTPITAPTTNSRRHDAWSTITPLITRPRPPPTPSIAEISPIATPMRFAGTSSRMMEKLSG